MADDNNRKIEATSQAGNPTRAAEGAVAFDSIVVPKGHFLGQPTEGQSRQDLPNPSVSNVHTFQSGGDPDRVYTAHDGQMKDDDYPSVPNPQIAGQIPEADSHRVGSPVNFNSVAPYEYPEFPMSSGKARGTFPL